MTFTPSTNVQGNPSSSSPGKGEPLERIIQTLKAMLPELRDRYGVISLGVFGSYVRGEQTPDSDLDLLVEFDQRPLTLLQFIALEYELSDELQIKVDLVEKSVLKPKIGERILQEVLPL
jgi:predicted nucleotidyltransferase